eukprot:3555514-Amphidinium_carterae.1
MLAFEKDTRLDLKSLILTIAFMSERSATLRQSGKTNQTWIQPENPKEECFRGIIDQEHLEHMNINH